MTKLKRVVDGRQSRRLPNKKLRSREHLLPSEVDALLEVAREHSRYPDRDYALILMMFRHTSERSKLQCWNGEMWI